MDHPSQSQSSLKSRVIKTNRHSLAARWNLKLLRALEARLKKHPEADIISLLPMDYSKTLRAHKAEAIVRDETQPSYCSQGVAADDIRARLSIEDSCTILFELSSRMQELLRDKEDLSQGIYHLLAQGEAIYKSAWASAVTVLRVTPDIVVKITGSDSALTEINTLAYLQKHLPTFPSPAPHGLVRFGRLNLLFSSAVSGIDLERAWPRMAHSDKISISTQLDKLLSQLRSIPHLPEIPFGSVNGEGCKDARRSLRISDGSITDTAGFEDFLFAGSKVATPLFLGFLRSLKSESSARGVFTHGDIRPANIMVHQGTDSTWEVVAMIDWENSGFYPTYWECVKMTNNLTLTDDHDWYSYLPECVAPRRYAIDWLVDRVLDRTLENS